MGILVCSNSSSSKLITFGFGEKETQGLQIRAHAFFAR
jgi:hypothetical protein